MAPTHADAFERAAHPVPEEFVAMLAHDLRNPLGPIRNAMRSCAPAAAVMRATITVRPAAAAYEYEIALR
jgi:signal transduction histidine kinase